MAGKDQNALSLTPSDIVGAVARGLKEAFMYLENSQALAVDVNETRNHLGRLIGFLDELENIQASLAKAQSNGASHEARAAQ